MNLMRKCKRYLFRKYKTLRKIKETNKQKNTPSV